MDPLSLALSFVFILLLSFMCLCLAGIGTILDKLYKILKPKEPAELDLKKEVQDIIKDLSERGKK